MEFNSHFEKYKSDFTKITHAFLKIEPDSMKSQMLTTPNLFTNNQANHQTSTILNFGKDPTLFTHTKLRSNKEDIKQIINKNKSRDSKKKENRAFYIRNKVFDSCDENKLEDENPFFLIKLDSEFKEVWEIFMLFTIFYSSFFTPLSLCFQFPMVEIDLVIEISLIMDIYLSFYTQIEDLKENIISSQQLISISYITGWFFLDLITCFPASLLELYSHDPHSLFLSILKWFALLRLLKLIKYPYLIKKKIVSDERLDSVIKQIAFLSIIINILACLFIFISNQQSSNNWIKSNNLDELSILSIYLASLYFHFQTFFNIGYGDLLPTTFSERVYLTIIMFLFFIIFPFFLNSIAVLLVNEPKSIIKFNQMVENIESVFNKYDISDQLQTSIKTTLKQEITKGYKDREEFFESLPRNSKHQLTGYIYNASIKKFHFFESKSYNFIVFIIPLLRHKIIKKKQILIATGEKFEEMFMVLKGIINVKLGEEFGSLKIDSISVFEHFGDIFLQTNKLSPFNLVASKKSELFTLNIKDFAHIYSLYPKIILNILEDSLKKVDRLVLKKNKIIDLAHENRIYHISTKLKIINSYLLQRDFDNQSGNLKNISNLDSFIIYTPLRRLNELIKNYKNLNHNLSIKRQTNDEPIPTPDKSFVTVSNEIQEIMVKSQKKNLFTKKGKIMKEFKILKNRIAKVFHEHDLSFLQKIKGNKIEDRVSIMLKKQRNNHELLRFRTKKVNDTFMKTMSNFTERETKKFKSNDLEIENLNSLSISGKNNCSQLNLEGTLKFSTLDVEKNISMSLEPYTFLKKSSFVPKPKYMNLGKKNDSLFMSSLVENERNRIKVPQLPKLKKEKNSQFPIDYENRKHINKRLSNLMKILNESSSRKIY